MAEVIHESDVLFVHRAFLSVNNLLTFLRYEPEIVSHIPSFLTVVALILLSFIVAFPVAQMVKNPPAMRET